jgi:NAD(P)-dependent dehydrogenase (short-subunit alcohol dehydrogenase family)
LPRSIFVRADVTREEEVAALVDQARTRFGRLDCMVNNAGMAGVVGSITQIPYEYWASTIAVLQTSVFYGIKYAARVMIEQRDGCILNSSSTAGIAGVAAHAYTAAKHAVVGLTRSATNELAPYGIRVNAVAPGTVVTNLTGNMFGGIDAARKAATERSPLGRAVEARDVAAGFLYLASDDGRAVTGQVLTIDAGALTCISATRYDHPKPLFIDSHTKRPLAAAP